MPFEHVHSVWGTAGRPAPACDFQVWSLSAPLPLCLRDSSGLPGLRPPRLREVCPAAAASELCLLAAETLSLPWQSTLSCHLPVTSQG